MDYLPTQNRMMRFFSNPVVGIVGTAASVIGVALALFFYFSEHNTRDLTAFVHPIRTSVVRTGQASKMSVRFEDRLIDSDVTAVQITVWNKGGLSIRPANVLKPVVIVMPGRRVLEATIKKQTREVVNFRLDSTKLGDGRIPLNWDILEKDDGAVIQLIYAGDDTADIHFEGVLEGQPLLSQLLYSFKLQQPEEQFTHSKWLILLPLIFFCSFMVFGLYILITNIIACCKPDCTDRFFRVVYAVVGLSFCASYVFILYRLLKECFGPRPPFGF
jgi:hypothetical protein